MKLFYLFRLPRLTTVGSKNVFRTSPFKHDLSDGCEFLDQGINMHDQPFIDTELGEY
jgi:hypothetical protein